MTPYDLDHGAENQDWEARWQQLGKTSFLRQTQVESPEKWQDFYDRVSDVWGEMAGITQAGAREMAAVMTRHGLVRPEDAILEIGCGPGNLSMALAEQGCRVTAMDNSRGMIRVLEERLRANRISGVLPLAADWNDLDPTPAHDLAVAAFFPEAFSPGGIVRLEQLARKACVLVLGSGVPAFPFHRQIWTGIMDAPYPVPGAHLACARNFLKQRGRSPEVHTAILPAVLDIECHRARSYFRAYFGMFGCSGPRTDRIIDRVLGPYADQGRIRLEGQSGAAMVCWPVPGPVPVSGPQAIPRTVTGCGSKG